MPTLGNGEPRVVLKQPRVMPDPARHLRRSPSQDELAAAVGRVVAAGTWRGGRV